MRGAVGSAATLSSEPVHFSVLHNESKSLQSIPRSHACGTKPGDSVFSLASKGDMYRCMGTPFLDQKHLLPFQRKPTLESENVSYFPTSLTSLTRFATMSLLEENAERGRI